MQRRCLEMGDLLFQPRLKRRGKWRNFSASFLLVIRHSLDSQRLDMDKFSGPLGEQLEAHALYLQDFFPRFFEHIDPESGPVKGFPQPAGRCANFPLVAVAAIAFNPLFWNFMARSGISY